MYQTYEMQWRLCRGEFKPLNGPVVENLPSNTAYVGLIRGRETKRATATEPAHLN